VAIHEIERNHHHNHLLNPYLIKYNYLQIQEEKKIFVFFTSIFVTDCEHINVSS